MWPIILAGYFFLAATTADSHHNVIETEMFAIPVSPNLFNWTYQDYDLQYRFHASILGKPELPSWVRYIYSKRHHSGFIFGTPPIGLRSPVMIEIIGLNSADYETRRLRLTLLVQPKERKALHEVELKIDNLNTEDLLDEHRMTKLKDILRTKLWTESHEDLYTTFLASAIDLGARLPLKPSDGEGLVVRFGSAMPFSEELKRLREEVRPLSRLPSCPRDYKRTTVERLFRDAGFALDWCRFELYNVVYNDRGSQLVEYLTEIPNEDGDEKNFKVNDDGMDLLRKDMEKMKRQHDIWTAPSKHDLPSRSYAKQFAVAISIPLLLFLLCVVGLSAVVCFHYAHVQDPISDMFLEDIFHVCVDYRRLRSQNAATVELCRYGTANTEQTQVPDNSSNKSIGVSPNNSLVRPYSPKSTTNLAGNYNRPQPPPYMGSATNSLHHRKSTADKTTPSTSGHTPEHRHVLEESIKLLNEANITTDFDFKDPVVDLNDGSEDYVPLKPETTGLIPMKQDLDDINVPELSKYGMGGMVGSI